MQYRVCDLSRFPMGDSQVLAYSPMTERAAMLSSLEVRLALACRTFASLDDHALSCCRELALDTCQVSEVRQQLQRLVDSGLLVSHDEMVRRCLDGPDQAADTQIGSLCIPTRNRPESLQRCLESYIDQSEVHGRQIDFVVADNSDDIAMSGRNREVLEGARARYGISVDYIGEEEKERFVKEVARRLDCPESIVRFAFVNDELCSVAMGGNRNILLMATAGSLTVQVDDDTICRIGPCPQPTQRVVLTSTYDPTEFWFSDPKDSAQSIDGIAGSINFFSLHEQLLARLPGSLVKDLSVGTVDLDGASTAFFRRINNGGGTISVTALGVEGDSGANGPLLFMRLNGDSRTRLLRSETSYRRAIATHEVVRCVTNATISNGTFCSGMNLGLDNRTLLPPFMPVQRSEDAIFAALIRASGTGYFGFLPCTLRHRRPTKSNQSLEQRASGISSGDIVEVLIAAFRPVNDADASKNLSDVGKMLIELGSSSPSEFDNRLRQALWSRALNNIGLLERLLKEHDGSPDFWALDVKEFCSILRRSLTRKDYLIPVDLRDCFGADHARILMQRLVLRFGQMLQIWPEVHATACALRKEGWRFGRED